MSLFIASITQPKKMLGNLLAWCKKAEAYAAERSFEADNLVGARLAPDQFPFARQIQSACDTAKFIAARVGSLEAPAHADDEKTFAELTARIDKTIAFLDTIEASSIDGKQDEQVKLSFLPKPMRAYDYVVEFALPNFYFHLNHAYAILRHNGVPLGKIDYIGSVTMID